MRKPKGNDQYVKAVEYSHTLEKLLIMERENSAALRDKLEAADRERDELRAEQAEHDEQIAKMEGKFSLAKCALDSKTARCDRAEAELRRRDAAAGEPVVIMSVSKNSSDDFQFEIQKRMEDGVYELYTAAPPAVLPPEVTEPVGEYCLDDREGLAWMAGTNWMRQQCLELGAQQQNNVQLPMPFDVAINLTRACGDIEYRYHESGEHFDRDEILAVLDAANVKYEVKK